MTAEETAALDEQGEKDSQNIGGEQPEQPAPPDIGGEHTPGDNAIPFESITQNRGKAQEPDKNKSEPDPPAPEEKAPAKTGRGRPPKAENAEKTQGKPDSKISPEHKKALSDYEKALADWNSKEPWERPVDPPQRPKPPKQERKPPEKPEKSTRTPRPPKGPKTERTAAKEEAPAPPEPEQPPAPRDATRNGEAEQIVYINLTELRPFKDHPFGVRDDAEMKALVESVKIGGVNQPALVRPHPDGQGYEIVAGHRRQMASELAAYANMPCIVRKMTDEEAILAMTDDNLRQRETILPSEKAVSLKMQVDAIKRQGARNTSGQNVQSKEAGQRSVDIVGERNGMNAKQVQRYISLTNLVPDLLKLVDEAEPKKRLGFTQAVEFSFVSRKNQNLIAVSIEGEEAKPSLAQAKRLRELDKEGKLSGDIIDGILSEEKKEVIQVIISGEELNKYFGKEKTPREMKEQIIKLLDDWAGKEKDRTAPQKNPER